MSNMNKKPAGKKFDAMKYLQHQAGNQEMMAPIAMMLAVECCKMGHDPHEAESIIHLTPDQFESLLNWFAVWNRD